MLKIVVGTGGDGLLAKFEAELANVAPSLPPAFNPMALSQTRMQLHSLACKAYVKGNNINGMKKHCPIVLGMTQIGGDNDEWAIVGMGEIAMKEERWEEAVRHFRNAFEKGGRSSQDVCPVERRFDSCPDVDNLFLHPDLESTAKSGTHVEGFKAEGLLQGLGCFARCRHQDNQEGLVSRVSHLPLE